MSYLLQKADVFCSFRVYGKKRPWIFHVKLEKIYEEEKSSR
jgi:hypothetical protein